MTAPRVASHGALAHEVAPRGIAFRETMSGWFAMGTSDPREGARRGREAGTRLRMRVAIRIPDLDGFLEDREHPGMIVGLVDFPPLGRAMPAERGDFRLFAPERPEDGAPPGAKLMVYGLTFRHGGDELHLAGRKLVRGGAPWRLWGETTTLFTTLHREGLGVGPAIGAGVLRLGPVDFLSILPTLRSPGSAGAGDALGALTRFGRFFGAELWDSYARRRPAGRGAPPHA